MSTIRPTTYQAQIKIFEAAGCRYVRTHGDHLVYAYPGAMRPVVIPKYQEVPAFIVETPILKAECLGIGKLNNPAQRRV